MSFDFKTISDVTASGDTSSIVDEHGLIRDADVAAHRIAALIHGGMSLDEVIQDYPNLTAAQIDAALRFAEANQNAARSFPTRTAKSVLRDGGGGGLAEAFAAAREEEN